MEKSTEDREVLARLIHRLMVFQEVNTAEDVADAILAAGFRRPGSVTDAGDGI